MSHNRAIWRALHSLTHPLSMLAILGLLFNDHWLRYAYPSWLTGKLGDFTWLVFAPFIAALLFAWLIPRTGKRHSQIVGWLSIGFIGVWFATAKTIPLVHEWTTQTLYAIVGWEGQLRLDATDLLTLPALLISWYIWRNASDDPVSLKPLAYIAFGLGILGTLASDIQSYYDYGVTHICAQNNVIYAPVNYQEPGGYPTTYYSSNGGLFWSEKIQAFVNFEIRSSCIKQPTVSKVIVDNDVMIRWVPNDKIEASNDGGKTWVVENDLVELDQEIRDIYLEYRSKNFEHFIYTGSAPVNAYYDESSGNVIFAMRQNGVLVRKPDATYTWVTVGDYGLDNLSTKLQYASYALFLELWLALATIFLVIATSVQYMRHKSGHAIRNLIILSWIGYGAILVIHPFERISDMTSNAVGLSHFISFWMLLILGIPMRGMGHLTQFPVGRVFDCIGRYWQWCVVSVPIYPVDTGTDSALCDRLCLFNFPDVDGFVCHPHLSQADSACAGTRKVETRCG